MPFYVNQSSQFYKIFVALTQIFARASLKRYINDRNNFCTKTNSISFNTTFLLYFLLVFILTLKKFASGNFLLIWSTDLSIINEMKYSKFWLYERRYSHHQPLLHLNLYNISYHSLFLMLCCFLLTFVSKKALHIHIWKETTAVKKYNLLWVGTADDVKIESILQVLFSMCTFC